jgi:hypothetical protein
MAKKLKKTIVPPIVAVEVAELERVEAAVAAETDTDILDDLLRKRSVVKPKYKMRYIARAREAGETKKAAKRSAWDWLAQELAAECLDPKGKIDIVRFTAILTANGVDHSRWTNRSKGWEGRFRMTGRLSLQRVVAETGVLVTAEGAKLQAPADWVAKYRN